MPQRSLGAGRRMLRAALLIAHLLVGLLLALAVSIDRFEWVDRPRVASWWHRHLLAILGIRVQRRGSAPDAAHLSVANHVSWLDIPVICAAEPIRFIGKSEIRRWPLAGWLATASGTFYLRRGKADAQRLIAGLVACLQHGGSVALFPEGTTTSGDRLLRFHPRMLGPAIEAGCIVQPIALRYRPTADGRMLAPFVGDDDLLSHLLRLLREPQLDAELIYCAPIAHTGRSRAELAEAARAAIAQALGLTADSAPRTHAQIAEAA